MMKNKKSKIIFIICLIVFIAAVVTGVAYKVHQKKNSAVYDKLQEQSNISTLPDTSEEKPVAPSIPVDFTALKEQNPDIYAWIHIDDTKIDYPIVQSQGEDDYYLDHTIEGKEGLPGSIYTEYTYTSQDMSDPVTVIYGHNMRDKSMFGILDSYLDEDFRNQHSEIKIYTPEHIFTYKVVYAVTYDDRHIQKNYDFQTTERYQNFLTSLQTERKLPSWMEEPFNVTTNDRMIVLSTCNGNESQRFLIGAVLTHEE